MLLTYFAIFITFFVVTGTILTLFMLPLFEKVADRINSFLKKVDDTPYL